VIKVRQIVDAKTPEMHYVFENGYRLRREDGKTPNGNDMNMRWVLRSDSGCFIDFDKYRSDIADRNELSIYSTTNNRE